MGGASWQKPSTTTRDIGLLKNAGGYLNKGRRPAFPLACLTVLLICIMLVGSGSVGKSKATGESASTACTPLQLANASWSAGNTIDLAAAVENALSAKAYQEITTTLGLNATVSYDSSSEQWHDNPASCSVSLVSIDIVFGANTSSGRSNIVVIESPGSLLVEDAYIQSSPAEQAGGAGSGLWTGYSYDFSGQSSEHWLVPTISRPSTGCGSHQDCDMLDWLGETAEYGGSSGIAQTGTEQYLMSGTFGYYV